MRLVPLTVDGETAQEIEAAVERVIARKGLDRQHDAKFIRNVRMVFRLNAGLSAE